jgi:hypothetical protein
LHLSWPGSNSTHCHGIQVCLSEIDAGGCRLGLAATPLSGAAAVTDRLLPLCGWPSSSADAGAAMTIAKTASEQATMSVGYALKESRRGIVVTQPTRD